MTGPVLRLRSDERGFAIITAFLIAIVVMILGSVAVGLAVHSSTTGGRDMRQTQAIAAAEAGLDYYFSLLSSLGGASPPCSVDGTLPSSSGRFTVTATFFAVEGSSTPMACPLAAGAQPQTALLNSVGTPASGSSARTMQALVRLSLARGATFGTGDAIFAESSIDFVSAAQIGGSDYNDADIYSNGTVSLASSSTIYGSIQAMGDISLRSNSEVKRSVWAGGNIAMASSSRILGNATATGSISLASNARIYGDAKAGGTISGGTVDGYASPNTQVVDPPPPRPYPDFTYVQSDWVSAGYTIQIFSGATACSAAEAFIRTGWTAGDLVVRVDGTGAPCTLTFNGGTYNVPGNLAIVSDAPVWLRTNARFTPTPSGSAFTVFVFAGLSGSEPCSLRADPNSGFNPGLTTMLYVPSTCTLDMRSNSVIASGHVIGGTASFKHTAAFVYKPVTVPGSGVGGFNQDIVYKREIVTPA